ncbi:MAG: S41 family peptidase [Rhodothermales bacterium]
MRSRRLLLVPLLFAVLGVGFTAGFYGAQGEDDFFAIRKNFEIFAVVYEELVGGYVDDVDPEQLMRSGIDAMLRDLDPYTTFIDEADNADIDIITRGRYGGVGLNIGMRGGKITVISPVEGASGYKQGVRAGDVVLEVAGKSVADFTLADLRSLLRGEPGTAVEIVVEREGEPEGLQFLLTREEVKLKNVTYSGFVGGDTLGGMGYVKLERFARGAAGEVRRAVEELQASSDLEGLVLDLRDNPGGLLDAAVEISQLFVPQGSVIVSTRGRLPQNQRVYRSKAAPIAPDVPLVVLMNEYSASASEIVAGAIQDLDRGVIAGVPSFGKGLVQVIKTLPYNTSLKMTTSKYYTPSGRSIQAIDYGSHDGSFAEIPDSLRRPFRTAAGRSVMDGRGIEPDLAAPLPPLSELEQALERRAAFFFFANAYAAQHPSIADHFEVDDATLESFKSWLETEDFSYRTAAEREVNTIIEGLEEIGYDEATDEAEALRTAIREEKAADFERYADRLKERLRSEILARYESESDQVEAALDHDEQLAEALGLLVDAPAYQQVLAGR